MIHALRMKDEFYLVSNGRKVGLVLATEAEMIELEKGHLSLTYQKINNTELAGYRMGGLVKQLREVNEDVRQSIVKMAPQIIEEDRQAEADFLFSPYY